VLPLAVVSSANIDLTGGVGERTYRPSTLVKLRPEYRLGVGHMDLDLSRLKLPAGRTEVTVSLGMGEVIVHPPSGACVSTDVQIGLGAADLPDRVGEGPSIDVEQSRQPAVGQPELVVKADVGVGHVQVEEPSACA
jgi:hypothetical protein